MKKKSFQIKMMLVVLAVTIVIGSGLIGLAIAKSGGFSLNSPVSFPVDI